MKKTKNPIMLNEKQVKENLERLLMIRAGSIFSREFEMGAIYALLIVLGYDIEVEYFGNIYNGIRMRQIKNMQKTTDLLEELREYFDITKLEYPDSTKSKQPRSDDL